jgi:threonine synthase
VCSVCGRTWELADRRWRCSCGGLLDLVGPVADVASGLGPGSPLDRYRAALPPGSGRVDLGLSVTPLRPMGPGRFVKCEFEHPTGSFKDRGAAAMFGVAAGLGVRSAVVDSSGNAGRAAAAHARRAGIDCTVYLPAGTDPDKVAGIARYGASVVEVAGGRAAAATAAQDAVETGSGIFYASHVYQPTFHHGVKTLAFELNEQVPGLDTVVVPAGNGTLVLGLWLGFGLLARVGRAERVPRIVAVQADRCAPLLGRALSHQPTAAVGIAIADPPRASQIRAAVTASGGRLVAVSEDAIEAARAELSRFGFDVEPTGAVAWAARRDAGGNMTAVVLSGR